VLPLPSVMVGYDGGAEHGIPGGSGFTPATLLTGIASVVLVLAFVWVMWVMWVSVGTFRAWWNDDVAHTMALTP
jgi:integrating conjugative element protein (TIGR03758 family)